MSIPSTVVILVVAVIFLGLFIKLLKTPLWRSSCCCTPLPGL